MAERAGTTRGLVIRRARVQSGVVVAAFLLVLGATIALVTVAAFAADTTARAVAATGQHATISQRRIITQAGAVTSFTLFDTSVQNDVKTTLTALPSTTVSGILGNPRALSDSDVMTLLWTSPAVRDSATLVSGSWPAPPEPTEPYGLIRTPVPVAVSASDAARYHLAVGSQVPLPLAPGTFYPGAHEDRGVVVGIYRPKSATDPVWAIPASAGGAVEFFLVDPRAFDTGRVQAAGGVAITSLDLSKLSAGNVYAADSQLHQLSDGLANDPSLGLGVTASDDAAALLDGTTRALTVSRPVIAIPAVEAIAIACCAIAATARLLARDRRAQAALMRSRGASVWHLARYDALEALAVTVPAMVIAPFIAVRLAGLLPPADSLKPVLGGAVWLADGAAAVVFTLVLVLSGSITARDDSVARVGRIPVSVAAAGIDLAALALAAAGVWELRTALTRQAASGSLDPLTVCAPTLAVLAFALASVRLVSVVGRVAQAIANRARGWSGAFGSWHAARMIRTHTAAVVLIAAATALVVISGANRIAADRSVRDQADFLVGADVRGTAADVQPLRNGGAAADLPGVRTVAAVDRLTTAIGRSGTGGKATLLATDPARWQQVAILRSDLAPGGVAQAVAPLRAHPVPQPGLGLPGKPHQARFGIRLATASGQPIPGATLDVTLAGQDGEPDTLSAPLAAVSGPQTVNIDLSAAIGDGSRVAWPLRVIRIGVVLPTPSAGTEKVDFDLLAADTDSGRAELSAGQSWTATSSVNVAVVANTNYDLSLVRQSGSATAASSGAALLHGSFDPGTDPPSVGYPGRSSYSAGLAVPAPAAVPGLVTPQFLAAAGAQVGSTVDLSLDGSDLLLKVVGSIPALPSTQPSDNAVLVDQSALAAYAAAHSLAAVGSGELWIAVRPGAATQVSTALISGGLSGQTQDRFSTAAQLTGDPVRSGPIGALIIAALAAVLFALFGYGAHVAAVLRERVPQLAAVRALGVGAGRIGVAFGVEQSLVAAVGVIAGGAVGLLLSQLIVPVTVLTRDGQAPIPSVLSGPDWAAVGWSAAATVAVIAAAGLWAGLLVPRLRVAALLRAGDAG
ncbi:MAG TPA: FtsX-like permease family protein [Actinocrinis sp.]|uniref:FtsX-like permease family protein n=1 Tax=Actinocrinis sp. TaxID=1920516 RepID=UPI002D4378A7|nr:FtsX-like permease family protein [Actinocrinis sp.]HZU57549.1 FtsX-like permease family protein [Actinocrinis sp.]